MVAGPGIDSLDILHVEETIWLAVSNVRQAGYDFPFATVFACRRGWTRPERIVAIGRFGAIDAYEPTYRRLEHAGIALVNDPLAHRRAAELPTWYPTLTGLTPRSVWFDAPPIGRDRRRTPRMARIPQGRAPDEPASCGVVDCQVG